MHTCARCGAPYMTNTLFCESCGAPLHVRHESAHLSERFPEPGSGPLRSALLEMSTTGRVIELQLTHEEIVLGRAATRLIKEPAIDLTEDGALEKGVSRRHARLLLQGADLLVEDLNSSNGTWVNDVRLRANQPFPVKHGDHIRLGRLRMRINLLAGRSSPTGTLSPT